jgi:hypothetical protein
MRLPAAVKAMSMAVLMDVIFAESIRVKANRCVCASTTAMLLLLCQQDRSGRALCHPLGDATYIGTPTSSACCSAACRATRAPLCVNVGTAAVADAVGVILKYVCSNNMVSKEKEHRNR